jgi:hypothetical protein
MRVAALSDVRGFGLLTVLLWLSLLATTALGVALATSAEPPATSALHDRLRLARAAESAVSLAVASLAAQPDWSLVPGAGVASPFTDGAPGVRVVAGVPIDLLDETRQRTCGRVTPCDDVATSTVAPGRPWGVRNPRWRLVVHLPLADVDAVAARACPCYLVAWVADDPADDDGDPTRDAPPGVAGHGVLLVRGAALGGAGTLAEAEALVAQPCRRSNLPCGGSRVQSWGPVRDGAP